MKYMCKCEFHDPDQYCGVVGEDISIVTAKSPSEAIRKAESKYYTDSESLVYPICNCEPLRKHRLLMRLTSFLSRSRSKILPT